MNKGVKFRIYPNREQQNLIHRAPRGTRELYNLACGDCVSRA